jgi:hypothetical protein
MRATPRGQRGREASDAKIEIIILGMSYVVPNDNYQNKRVLAKLNNLEIQLNRIEKKLDDLFYAPEMTGMQEAKIDFEHSIKGEE